MRLPYIDEFKAVRDFCTTRVGIPAYALRHLSAACSSPYQVLNNYLQTSL